MKLFRVEATVVTVVAAEDFGGAWEFMRSATRQAVADDAFAAEVVEEIESLDDLPSGWDGDCIPYGDGDGNTRIKELLS